MRVAVILTNAYNFEDDKCWWSISQLAKKVQSSNKQVSTAIQTFKDLNIFHIKSGRTGRANEYKPNFKIILQYPSLASKENLLKVEKFSTDQTIKLNYKLNTGSKSKGWGKKSVESSYPIDRERNLKDYVGFVQRGQHTTWLSDDMVKEMYRRQLITEEDYKKW